MLLMQHGADPNIKDGEGCSGLHLAAQFGHTAIVAYLVAKCCHINDTDGNGMTALMWSCFRATQGLDPTRLLLTLGENLKLLYALTIHFYIFSFFWKGHRKATPCCWQQFLWVFVRGIL